MKSKNLGPVYLKIEDCLDCPFCDADATYTICEAKNGPRNLPIYDTHEKVITPPKNCPLRLSEVKPNA